MHIKHMIVYFHLTCTVLYNYINAPSLATFPQFSC